MDQYDRNGRKDEGVPQTREQLSRCEDQEPTTEVPPHLMALTDSKPLQPKRMKLIYQPEAIEPKTTMPVPAYRPPWIGASFAPKPMRLPPPPRLFHGGYEYNPLVVFPPHDDRKIYSDLNYPWTCVCRITNATGAVGSGVLIGPRHVLTASHMVDWSTDQPEKIEVHLAGTVAAAVAFDVLAMAFTHIQGNTALPSDQVDEDYAVLVTEERLGERFGWFGTRIYDSSWDGGNYWWSIGYPAGVIFPFFQRDKSLDEDALDYGSGRAMTTSADTQGGQSGSPMFGFWDGLPYVVAVMSAEHPSKNENWCSGGSDLTALVNRARNEYP